MTAVPSSKINSETLSPKMFNRFREFVEKELGIKMPDAKHTLLQGRLQKRMRKMNIPTFETYYDYVFSGPGKETERIHLMDAVTTNKTDFFREPAHFDFLVQKALPAILNHCDTRSGKPVVCWSAGCSTGKEPYTLSMVLSEFARTYQGFRFSIFATDISTKVLDLAISGIYDEEDVAPVPLELRKRYLMRSKNREKTDVRIIPELRSKIIFRRLNFMDEDYQVGEPVNIIFFRNVLIYFNRPTQEKVINRLCRYLLKDGFFFTGHSETLSGLNVPLLQVAPTVYRRK
jgi:chemotaxis protein methyltransferase CheR